MVFFIFNVSVLGYWLIKYWNKNYQRVEKLYSNFSILSPIIQFYQERKYNSPIANLFLMQSIVYHPIALIIDIY